MNTVTFKEKLDRITRRPAVAPEQAESGDQRNALARSKLAGAASAPDGFPSNKGTRTDSDRAKSATPPTQIAGSSQTPSSRDKLKHPVNPANERVPTQVDQERQSRSSHDWGSAIVDESLDDDTFDYETRTQNPPTSASGTLNRPASVSVAKAPARIEDADSAIYWLTKIRAVLVKSVDSLIEAGSLLLEAKGTLDHGEWLKMFENGQLPFGERQAQYLMQVAGHRVLANPNNRSLLPQSRTALVELAKGDESKVEQVIQDGKVHPAMTAKDARLLIQGDNVTAAKVKTGHVLGDAKKCGRGLKTLGKLVAEAKSWQAEQRQRFLDEATRLLESLAQ